MKRSTKAILLVLITITVALSQSGIAAAAPFARAQWRGYFGNRLDTNGDDLWLGGLDTPSRSGTPGGRVDTIDEFVYFYKWNLLNSPKSQSRVSASFTILTMLGYPAGTPTNIARARLTDWDRAVRWYAANNRINFNFNYRYAFNTYWQDSVVPSDVAYYNDVDTRRTVVFLNTNGTSYAIKRDCANPVGNMSRIYVPPVAPRDYNLRPVASVTSGAVASPGDQVTFSYNIANSGAASSPNPTRFSVQQITYPPGFSGSIPGERNNGNINQYPGNNGTTTPESSTTTPIARGTTRVVGSPASRNLAVPPGTPLGSRYCRVLVVAPAQANSAGTVTIGNRWSAAACVIVAKAPLVYFNDGDVWTGGTFEAVDANCPVGRGSVYTSVGSKAEYALFGSGAVSGFGSGNQSRVGANGKALTFANSPPGIVGDFQAAGSRHCLTNFAQAGAGTPRPLPGGSIDLNSIADQSIIRYNGNIVIGNSTNIKKRVTIIASGSIRISGNIIYDNSGYSSIQQLPQVVLITERGNITVEDDVDTIEGIFIARGDGAAITQGGAFRTCESYLRDSNTCNKILNINGAVMANVVSLRRTGGDRRDSDTSKQAAEYFNLRPDAFLGSYGAAQGGFQTRTVEEVELPPRY